MEGATYRQALCACLILIATAYPFPSLGFEYHYFDTPVALSGESGRVAVRITQSQSFADILNLIQAAGLTVTEATQHPLEGWSLWRISGGHSPAELIALLTDQDNSDGVRDFYFSPVFSGASGLATIVTTAVLLRWRDAPDSGLLQTLLPAGCLGDPEPESFGGMEGAYRIEPGCHSGIAVLDYANALAQRDETLFSEPDMIVGGQQSLTPSDEFYDDSWHLNNTGQSGGVAGIDINAPEAWDITTGDTNVVTVVIDVGVELDHPDIRQQTGNDFTSDNSSDGSPVNSCDNHGTPVAGAISAPINNQLTVGAAPGTNIRSARTFISEVSSPCSGRWSTQFSWTVNALDWAQSMGAQFTNNSNSYDQQSSSIASKYEETRNAGMVHFASAGNDAKQGVNFPASVASVNAVSAVTDTGTLASFSNFGSGLSMSGPGEDIYVPDRQGSKGFSGGDFAVLDGTSFAAPLAAGVGALLKSRASNLTASETEMFLQASARDLGAGGFDDKFGWGMVDGEAALRLLEIFEDDFEGGDTSRWSNQVP